MPASAPLMEGLVKVCGADGDITAYISLVEDGVEEAKPLCSDAERP